MTSSPVPVRAVERRGSRAVTRPRVGRAANRIARLLCVLTIGALGCARRSEECARTRRALSAHQAVVAGHLGELLIKTGGSLNLGDEPAEVDVPRVLEAWSRDTRSFAAGLDEVAGAAGALEISTAELKRYVRRYEEALRDAARSARARADTYDDHLRLIEERRRRRGDEARGVALFGAARADFEARAAELKRRCVRPLPQDAPVCKEVHEVLAAMPSRATSLDLAGRRAAADRFANIAAGMAGIAAEDPGMARVMDAVRRDFEQIAEGLRLAADAADGMPDASSLALARSNQKVVTETLREDLGRSRLIVGEVEAFCR